MSADELFDASYTRIFGDRVSLGEHAAPFFEAFYHRFLEDPDIARTFAGTDMSRQAAMLRKSFFHLVAFYLSHKPTAELTRIAQLHHTLGIESEAYDKWLDALMTTVREFDPACDPATELAWRLALTPGITYMRLIAWLDDAPRSPA